jgi:predicted PurR-regulated permease PerM
MSTTAYITTIIALAAFMLGTVVAVVIFIGGQLGRLEDRVEHMDQRLTESIQHLREDVAVLKATH